MQETWVQSLGWEDRLEKGMAAHSSILAWRIPWTEEPGRPYGPWGCKQLDTTVQLTHTQTQGWHLKFRACKKKKKIQSLCSRAV